MYRSVPNQQQNQYQSQFRTPVPKATDQDVMNYAKFLAQEHTEPASIVPFLKSNRYEMAGLKWNATAVAHTLTGYYQGLEDAQLQHKHFMDSLSKCSNIKQVKELLAGVMPKETNAS